MSDIHTKAKLQTDEYQRVIYANRDEPGMQTLQKRLLMEIDMIKALLLTSTIEQVPSWQAKAQACGEVLRWINRPPPEKQS